MMLTEWRFDCKEEDAPRGRGGLIEIPDASASRPHYSNAPKRDDGRHARALRTPTFIYANFSMH